MVRKVINFKQLAVTPLKIEIPRIAKKKVLSAAWKEAGELVSSGGPRRLVSRCRRDSRSPPPLFPPPPNNNNRKTDVEGKFASSAWGKKLAARSAKAAMTDLDRYKAKAAKAKKPAAAAATKTVKAPAAKAK